jgi:ATP-dependent RNA helicase DeaD
MLLLEPLLEEFTPSQLAAAAAALLRERLPDAPPQPLPAWTRLYFGVGRRDGVRPADLVGAITGETRVTGEQVGRIEIRDTHCSVEVAASVADQVIKGLATTTIRGRPANVRVFRE